MRLIIDLSVYKNEIQKICEEEDVEIMGVFGSVARGEENKDSDIDIIIKYQGKDKSLFDLVGLENRLSKLFGRKVDLHTENSISPYIIDKVEEDLKLLYINN